MWVLNYQPQDEDSHALPFEPASAPGFFFLNATLSRVDIVISFLYCSLLVLQHFELKIPAVGLEYKILLKRESTLPCTLKIGKKGFGI